jgi:hypothetical protein
MNKIFSNKKIILIILIIILTIILLLNYIKIAEISLLDFFDKHPNSKEGLFFKNEENKLALTEIAKNEDRNSIIDRAKKSDKNSKNKAKAEAKTVKNDKIESIVLISEIKDPFNPKENKEKVINEDKFLNKAYNQDLLFLEKNIIAEKLEPIDKSGVKALKQKKEIYAAENYDQKEYNKFDKNINLPFKLLGIIKNKDNSTALFLYQGQNISRKENEKIDIYKIEEINNQNISLTYQTQRRIIKLWEGEGNEE